MASQVHHPEGWSNPGASCSQGQDPADQVRGGTGFSGEDPVRVEGSRRPYIVLQDPCSPLRAAALQRVRRAQKAAEAVRLCHHDPGAD